MDFDLMVIGAGSGGVRAARMAAKAGKKVAVVEKQETGGTCVNVGCVPKKLFVYGSHFVDDLKDASGFGWQIAGENFSWPTLKNNKDKEINRLNSIYENLLESSGVRLIRGFATLESANQVRVDGQSFSSESILLATGSRPFVPDFPGNELVDISDAIFQLEQLPGKVLMVGGGYISVELAGIFHALGVDTHIAYRGELFLRGFDSDIRSFLHQEMRKKGVKISFTKEVKSIQKCSDGLQVSFEDGDSECYDRVFYATGRQPNIEGLGLEKLGIKLKVNGAIEVDDNFMSSIPGLYAIGDVVDRYQLTPVAIQEAMVFVNRRYGDASKVMCYDNIPSAVFSQPNVACVGLSEEQALHKGFEIKIFESEFRALKLTLTENPQRNYMKLVVDKSSDKVLGAHMVGEHAAEIIQGLAIAMKSGATKEDFDATIGIHPSSAEEFVTMREPRA